MWASNYRDINIVVRMLFSSRWDSSHEYHPGPILVPSFGTWHLLCGVCKQKPAMRTMMDLNHFVWEKFTAGSEERWGDPREIILWHKGASCLIIPNVCVACVLIFDGKSITSAQKWFTREIESARSTKNYRGMPKIQNVWDCASLDRWHHHHKTSCHYK